MSVPALLAHANGLGAKNSHPVRLSTEDSLGAEESIRQRFALLRRTITLVRLLRAARIRPQWRCLPLFAQAIADAQQLLPSMNYQVIPTGEARHEMFDVDAAA